ncbi:hypothetical protein TrLO_g12221 [Triparma laevis f. longispina]|uniref:Uncharacterized protein n=1 Tax=Triparma laevis f. longispina TaxID=1714387 RepID=A0A9W7FMZ2_9STRA|nr:hypothetical protein TrLO_g12221 [Triparma laevis f. longispina]
MILVYPLGIPTMYFVLLYKKLKLIDPGQAEFEKTMSKEEALEKALKIREENEENDPSLKALSFLYDAYEPKRWWIEVFETLQKLALTGFLVFLPPGTDAQIVMSILMCLATTRVYSGTKPFIDPFNDKFAEVALWQQFMTMLGALCIKVNLDDESLQDRGYFDMALTATQFLPLLPVAAGDAFVVNFKGANAIGKKSLKSVHNEFEKERKKERARIGARHPKLRSSTWSRRRFGGRRGQSPALQERE